MFFCKKKTKHNISLFLDSFLFRTHRFDFSVTYGSGEAMSLLYTPVDNFETMMAPGLTPPPSSLLCVRVSHPISFLYCVLFVCLRPVSCEPYAASVSGLSTPWLSHFSNVYLVLTRHLKSFCLTPPHFIDVITNQGE